MHLVWPENFSAEHKLLSNDDDRDGAASNYHQTGYARKCLHFKRDPLLLCCSFMDALSI